MVICTNGEPFLARRVSSTAIGHLVVQKPKVRPIWGSRMSHGVKVLATAAFHRLRKNAANACRVATRRE